MRSSYMLVDHIEFICDFTHSINFALVTAVVSATLTEAQNRRKLGNLSSFQFPMRWCSECSITALFTFLLPCVANVKLPESNHESCR